MPGTYNVSPGAWQPAKFAGRRRPARLGMAAPSVYPPPRRVTSVPLRRPSRNHGADQATRSPIQNRLTSCQHLPRRDYRLVLRLGRLGSSAAFVAVTRLGADVPRTFLLGVRLPPDKPRADRSSLLLSAPCRTHRPHSCGTRAPCRRAAPVCINFSLTWGTRTGVGLARQPAVFLAGCSPWSPAAGVLSYHYLSPRLLSCSLHFWCGFDY